MTARSFYLRKRHLSKIVIVITLVISVIFGSKAQITKTSPRFPLIEVLEEVEGRFKISFSFADNLIKDLTTAKASPDWSLAETFDFLQRTCGITIRSIGEQYYTISVERDDNKIRICGYLKDNETKEVISFAAIATQQQIFFTDSLGYFNTQVDAFDSLLVITHLGYEDKKVTTEIFAGSNCPLLTLRAKSATLSEILVSNYLIAGIDKLITGEVRFKTKDLKVLPGLSDPDIFFSAQALPGVQSVSESAADLNIRGGRNDQNLVLWDGIRIYQPGHFFGLISVFNPYFVENVSLIKDGTSAVYGNSVSGVINIETDSKVKKEISGESGLNFLSADAILAIPIGSNASASFSLRRSISDVLPSPTFTRFFERAFRDTELLLLNQNDSIVADDKTFNFYDFAAKVNVKLSTEDQLQLSFLNISNRLFYQQDFNLGSNNIQLKSSGLDQSSFAGGLQYERKLGDNFLLRPAVTISSYQLIAQNDDEVNSQRFTQENKVLDLGLKLEGQYRWNSNFFATGGYELSEIGVSDLEDLSRPGFFQFIRRVMNSHAIYLEGDYTSSGGKFHARFGTRGNFYNELEEISVEPRLSVNYQVANNTSLLLQAERRSQFLSQLIDLQTDFLGVEKRRWSLANLTDIPLITSSHLSFGFQYMRQKTTLEINAYTKRVAGIITSGEGFRNQFELIRATGEYQSDGLEFLLNHETNQFTYWLSYTYSRNRYTFSDLQPPSFPTNLDIPHNTTLGINFTTQKIQLSTSINWQSGRLLTVPVSGNEIVRGLINFSEPNNERLASYFRVDFSGKYYFSKGEKTQSLVGLSILNLTGHANLTGAYYRLNDQGEIDRIEERALRFTPNVFYRIKF